MKQCSRANLIPGPRSARIHGAFQAEAHRVAVGRPIKRCKPPAVHRHNSSKGDDQAAVLSTGMRGQILSRCHGRAAANQYAKILKCFFVQSHPNNNPNQGASVTEQTMVACALRKQAQSQDLRITISHKVQDVMCKCDLMLQICL
jgi:hypothetical protein